MGEQKLHSNSKKTSGRENLIVRIESWWFGTLSWKSRLDWWSKIYIYAKASVSIRKGKQILCFEFDANVEFTMEEHKGSFKIRDINAQELDFEVHDIKMEEKGKVQDKIKEYLRLFLQKKLLAKFTDINE